jgi:hypothetical protein
MASKLSSIIGKLKRSPLTVIGALLGAVLILSAVAVASVMGSGKKDGNVVAVASQDQFADEASRFAKLQNDIKALLFDSDVDRNAIEEQTWQEANNSRVYTVKIGVRAGEAEALRQAVVDI